ncbi:hypothetical protein K461DRAFT_307041 [Myriangium duriaei CBS 260.36]|uniref:Xylanolytic transcriptional activator regulatory domain-containing protein n=1 Tax=Myriangium duriaei CBS 260.36 TaxID=1168546 RepID=A0A9P4J3A5_9PEZI|nr:hypothetical protein K461DRAFT_307041 [Myriangium duriaei CBS 260.36]
MHQTLPNPPEQFVDETRFTHDQQLRATSQYTSRLAARSITMEIETQHDVSPSPSDNGSLTTRNAGISYVNSSHWAAVLDSITELRNHFAQQEEDSAPQVTTQPITSFPKPQLLYNHPIDETSASLIECLPPRSTYEDFWKNPQSVPILWLGLLFSIMCLSTQHQQTFSDKTTKSQIAEIEASVDLYKRKTIECLLLGHYTRGGSYVLETLILYFLVECFHLKDMDMGIWILVGHIVQIALHTGYHRDAKHFPSISPFAGEMRRRVWALIIQLDSSVATQLGLPRLIRESHTDTAEPRNLYDSDFDEHTVDLPESRPESETTPTLYVLAKLRLLSVGAKIADVATALQSHPYAKIIELDQRIDNAQNALPSSLKWNGLASSLNVQSTILVQRIWLEVTQYEFSRSACLTAAMRILDLQWLVDEETQLDGLLYQSRWRVSSAFFNDFHLATSVLCYYLHTLKNEQEMNTESTKGYGLDSVDANKIRQLLRSSYDVWIRQGDISREARKAVCAIRYVLEGSALKLERPVSGNTPSASSGTGVASFPGECAHVCSDQRVPLLDADKVSKTSCRSANFLV